MDIHRAPTGPNEATAPTYRATRDGFTAGLSVIAATLSSAVGRGTLDALLATSPELREQ